MKKSLRNIKLLVLALAISASFAQIFLPANAFAQASQEGNSCNSYFLLTIPAWYNGVSRPYEDGTDSNGNPIINCEIASPNEVGGVGTFFWRIVLNIVEMMLSIVGYAAVGFIIYGGYKYIYGAGSPDKMVSARKTILNAVVGLIISIMSIAIVNTIAGSIK